MAMGTCWCKTLEPHRRMTSGIAGTNQAPVISRAGHNVHLACPFLLHRVGQRAAPAGRAWRIAAQRFRQWGRHSATAGDRQRGGNVENSLPRGRNWQWTTGGERMPTGLGARCAFRRKVRQFRRQWAAARGMLGAGDNKKACSHAGNDHGRQGATARAPCFGPVVHLFGATGSPKAATTTSW